MLPATFSAVCSELLEGLFTINRITAFNVFESLDNHPVDFLGLFLAEIPCDNVVINSPIEKLAGIRRATGFHFILDELLNLRLQGTSIVISISMAPTRWHGLGVILRPEPAFVAFAGLGDNL